MNLSRICTRKSGDFSLPFPTPSASMNVFASGAWSASLLAQGLESKRPNVLLSSFVGSVLLEPFLRPLVGFLELARFE